MTIPVDSGADLVGREVVLVVNRRGTQTPPPTVNQLPGVNQLGSLVNAATGVVAALAAVIENTVVASVNATLDRVVPVAVNAVVNRLDLTQLVLDRVDVNAIVAKANLDDIIERIPMIEIANYIIAEIDLPRIIRESTGGVATDAINSARMQSLSVDDLINKIADSVMFRRKARKVESVISTDPAGDL